MRESLSTAGVPMIYGDVPPFMALKYDPVLASTDVEVAVIGMPYDGLATFRGGATRHAPDEIRKYSLLFGDYNFDWDIPVLSTIRAIDVGNVDVVAGDNAESYRRFIQRLDALSAKGIIPMSIGGDHGITYPAVDALARHQSKPVGLVVFDTHLDLSESFQGDRLTRASPIQRICELPNVDPERVVIIGARGPRNLPEWTPRYKALGITVFPMAQVEAQGMVAIASQALEIASEGGQSPIYVSVDIDSVDPGFAPGTNSPEPGGLTSREIIQGLRIVARNGFIGFDVVEVAPDFDSRSGTTSTLAARLFAEAMACLAAIRLDRKDSWKTAHSTQEAK